jgi:AraC family transcriptional regulator, glycine betaine-responsive activator
MSITQISVSCGFQSTCHFSKSYRALYGRTPRSERQPQHSVQEFSTTPPPRKATSRARVPSI